MCVAAIINQPVSKKHLQCMEDDNPHGAGVAWQEGDQIYFRRGLTAAEVFKLQEDGVIGFPYLLHFRWATHGMNVPEMTHPFPTGPRALMGELSGLHDEVIIHNGTWNGYKKLVVAMEEYGWPSDLLKTVSDTAIAAYWTATDPNILETVQWAVARAYMDADGDMEIETWGEWHDKDGNSYSNLNWVPWAERDQSSEDRAWREWADRYYTRKGYSSLIDDIEEAEPVRLDANQMHFDSFDDYVRYKYGDEGANIIDRKILDESADPDENLVSESPDVVNEWLARQLISEPS